MLILSRFKAVKIWDKSVRQFDWRAAGSNEVWKDLMKKGCKSFRIKQVFKEQYLSSNPLIKESFSFYWGSIQTMFLSVSCPTEPKKVVTCADSRDVKIRLEDWWGLYELSTQGVVPEWVGHVTTMIGHPQPLFKVRGQHTIVSVQMEDIDLNKYAFRSERTSPSRPPDDVILVEPIAQISESAPLGIFAPSPILWSTYTIF